jgi:hypothetical protein
MALGTPCEIDDWVDKMVNDVLEPDYITSFATGFDGRGRNALQLLPERFLSNGGWEDGVAAWEAVKNGVN